jgi:pyruvate,orthophosphate dikinase
MSLGQVKSADPASQELGDLLDEHAELRDVVAQLREAGDAWILSGLLQRLHDLLQGHFAREEAAPAMREVLAAGLEPLIAEHREILESLRDRIAQVEEGEDDIPAELRREVEALLGRIHAHDARETRLLGGRIDPGSASVDASPLRSSALAVNLRRTAVDVAIPAEHAVLLEITEDQYGVHRETKKLLREINHRYVGWAQTLDELHRRATGDLARYLAHERAGEALHVFFGLYAKVVEQATPDSVRETALRRWLYVLEKVVDESGERLPELLQALQRAVSRLGAILREQPHLAVIASSRLRHLAGRLLAVLPEPTGHAVEHTLDLLAWSLRCVYEQWLSHPDPSDWYRELAGSEVEAGLPEVVTAISHARQRSGLDALDRAAEAESLAVRADALLGLPDGAQIERGFLEAAASLGGSDDASGDGSIARIHWLIRVLSLSDLAAVHRQALAEIHHAYRDALRDADRACFEQIVREIHAGLRRSSLAGSPAAYSLISKIGVDAMASEDPERIDVVVDEMLDWEFPGPQFSGFTDEWSVRVDPAHLRAIRAFLEVIGESPERARPLIAALVVRLTLGGVFMADTDLFQKDVSALLNRRIGPVYHQVRHLLALFPVYFNDIGAEGELREVSSRIDEIGARKDPLCHFLRKQCHVESNPRLLDFTDAIGGFFASGDPEPLRTYVSPSLYEALDPERPEFQAMHRALAELVGETGFGDWADRDAEALGRELSQAEMPPVVREKIQLLLRLRELVGRKYALHHDDLLERMSGFHAIDEEEVAGLREALAGGRDEEALSILLAVLERLKEIITDEKPTEGHEEIYRKRHIAVGIPSMYGRYREEKFEAVGLGLRIESLASVLFERMITVDEREYVSLGTLRRTATWLRMLLRAVRVDGCEARGVALGIGMLEQALETPGTTLDQHVNIFQIISRSIEQLIRIRFVDVYDDVLDRILARPLEDGSEPESADDSNRPETLKASEGFLRDRISKAFGVQSLDRLVTDTIRDLAHTRETFHREAQDLMMAFDLDRCTVPIGAGEEPRGGVVALGNKGHLVTRLAGAGLPVPAGFVLTTEVFRCRQAIRACAGLRRDLRGRLRDEITRLEGLTGSRFGEAERPLLLSVRSAAAISMPGVLDTFLNVGINREIARALASRSGSWGAARGREEGGDPAGCDARRGGPLPALHRGRRGRDRRRPPRAGRALRRLRAAILGRGEGAGLPRRASDRRGVGHRRGRPGHGLRQSRRALGHRCGAHLRRAELARRRADPRRFRGPGAGRRRREWARRDLPGERRAAARAGAPPNALPGARLPADSRGAPRPRAHPGPGRGNVPSGDRVHLRERRARGALHPPDPGQRDGRGLVGARLRAGRGAGALEARDGRRSRRRGALGPSRPQPPGHRRPAPPLPRGSDRPGATGHRTRRHSPDPSGRGPGHGARGRDESRGARGPASGPQLCRRLSGSRSLR